MIEKSLTNNSNGTVYSRLGIVLLAVYAVLYSVYYRSFAELNIQFSFLDFPIFVGEILLFTSIILLILHWKTKPIQFQRYHFLVLLYIFWLLIKAFYGYFIFGPLAFRNAALFYYPLFLFISYQFLENIKFSQKTSYFILVTLFVVIRFFGVATYFKVPYLITLIVCALNIKKPMSRYIVFGLLILLFPWSGFLENSRSHFLAAVSACVFVCFSYFFFILSVKLKYKLVSFLTSLLVVILVFYNFGNIHKMKSLIQVQEIIDVYKEKENKITELEDGFIFQLIKPQLYNKEGLYYQDELSELNIEKIIKNYSLESEVEKIFTDEVLSAQTANLKDSAEGIIIEKITSKVLYKIKERIKKEILDIEKETDGFSKKMKLFIREIVYQEVRGTVKLVLLSETKRFEREVTEDEKVEIKNAVASLVGERANIIFRYYIWKDMVEEIINERAFWGFSFGKPQRSKSLEILGWARGEWTRDGWITPHNSFLHVIYRAGIVGAAILLAIASLFLSTVKVIYRHRSFTGILFLSILIYWIVISNFLVILEFPYIAIPFWSLFGVTLAYSNDLSKSAKDRVSFQ